MRVSGRHVHNVVMSGGADCDDDGGRKTSLPLFSSTTLQKHFNMDEMQRAIAQALHTLLCSLNNALIQLAETSTTPAERDLWPEHRHRMRVTSARLHATVRHCYGRSTTLHKFA